MSHYDEFREDQEREKPTVQVVKDRDVFNDIFLGSCSEEDLRNGAIKNFLELSTNSVLSEMSEKTVSSVRVPHNTVRKDYLYTPLVYVKKPVQIKALLFVYTTKGIEALKTFVGDSLGDITKARHTGAKAEAHIYTLEDGVKHNAKHIATEGDFIIKGVEGEFYPCKPNIFWKTYNFSSIDKKVVNTVTEAL